MAKKLDTAKIIEQALQTDTVRRALAARADRVAPRAQRIAASAGNVELARALRREDGVRPGAKAKGGLRRPYARVIADLSDEQEISDGRRSKLTPTQVLRRAHRG